jgi:tetratricopeptide (TPR) repeat protein
LFTLVRPAEWQHSEVIMSVLLLIAFSAVFVIGQTTEPWKNLSKLARQLQDSDDFAASELVRREALRLAEKKLGPDDKQLAPLLADLAVLLHFEARDPEAEPLVQRALMIAKESDDRRATGVMLNILGVVLSGEGQKARAEPVLRRSVALLEESVGSDSIDAARAANNLATLYLDTRQYAKAETEMTRALPVYQRNVRPDDPELTVALSNMFIVLTAQHRSAEGEPYLRRALAIVEKSFPGSLKMANLQICLAALEAERANLKESASLLQKAMAIQERVLGPDHPELAHALAAYSTVLRRLHQKTEAKNALNRSNMILKSALTDVK